jgi:uncharacterized RDD family membrane protein YckC
MGGGFALARIGSPPDVLGGFFSMVNHFSDYVDLFMHTFQLSNEEDLTMNENIQSYAGFWRRFAAYWIDGIVIIFALGHFQLFLSYVLPASTPDWDTVYQSMNIAVAIISLPLVWAYFSGMESSPLQATIGKLAVGIYVTDLQGQRLSFGRATGRFFGKIFSGAILTIGYIMAGFNPKKQALHDMLAGTFVLSK